MSSLEKSRPHDGSDEPGTPPTSNTRPNLDSLPTHLEKMLGEARMAVWRWDPDQDVGTSSPLMNELWGLLPGQNLQDSQLGFSLIHPEDLETQQRLVRTAVAQGGTWHNQFRIIRPRDGRIAWLEERAHAVRDPVTGKVAIDGVTWEVTARKDAERERGASEQKYQTLFHSIDEGFALWKLLYDETGHPRDALLLESNPGFDALPGHANALGKTNREIFPDMENWWFETYRDVIESGNPVRFDRFFPPLERWFEVHISALGRAFPDQVAVVFTDITERRASAEKLLESEARKDFLVRLEDALRPLHEVTDIQETACRLLAEYLEADRVYYSRLHENESVAEIGPDYHRPGLPGISGRYPLDAYAEPLKTLYRGEVFMVADSADAPGLPPETVAAFQALGVRSVLCLPLMKDGRLAWALGVLALKPRAWNARETALAREVAERTWSAVSRAQAEVALRASEQKYRTLFESIDEAFCLIEMIYDASGKPVDFTYLEANPAFLRHAGFDPVGKRVRVLLPDYEQIWLDHYAHTARTGEIVRLDHSVHGLDDQWFRMSAFRHGDPAAGQVAIVFTNITEERRTQEVLRESEARNDFLVRLEDALRPLEKSADIQGTATRLLGERLGVDRVYYAEIDEAEGVAEIPQGYSRPGLSGIAGKYPLDLFIEPLRPLREGRILRIPDTRDAPDQPRETVETFLAWGAVSVLAAPLMKEGRLRWALSILHSEPRVWTEDEIALVRETAERTWAAVSRAQSEEDLRASEQKYHALFDSIDEGFCLIQMLFDEADKPVDFEYLETNPAFVRHAGMPMQGRRIKDIIPDFEQVWLDQYGRVALTGELARVENQVAGLDKQWFQTTAFRHGPAENRQVAVIFTNVTERKLAEQNLVDFNARLDMQVRAKTADLKESRDLLQSVLDTSLIGMSYLQAVRDDDGKVVDFVIRMLNKELERETGRDDLVGRYYGQELPGIHTIGLFKVMVEVLETGEPNGLEYFYPHDGFNKWFSSMFVKFEDGLVATNLDISRQKKVEEDLKNALSVLELENKIHAYAEEIASMGTWTWNTATEALTFSDNLNRLFGLKPGETKTLKQLMAYIHPDDLERVLASSADLRKSGERNLALEYRVVRKDGVHRHFSNRVQKVGDLDGGHLLVGITEDITDRKRTEDRNRRLRLERVQAEERQRLALFAATLDAQEAERKRISESLHNGIGQMLYGIQLNLNLLDLKLGDAWLDRHAEQQRRTTSLLSDAINESRRVSHELIPNVLQDFGLQVAIDDMCKQFHGRLDVDCRYSGLPDDIPQYISIALYRALQELMTNVIKHAEAGSVKVHVHYTDNAFELEVVDNGIGFTPNPAAKGIGLKTLREKLSLLKGEFHMDSNDEGTKIRVRIPRVNFPEG